MSALHPHGFTEAQARVLDLLADGYSYKEIADRLETSLANVAGRLRWARRKIGARNNMHLAVRYALLKAELAPAQCRCVEKIAAALTSTLAEMAKV